VLVEFSDLGLDGMRCDIKGYLPEEARLAQLFLFTFPASTGAVKPAIEANNFFYTNRFIVFISEFYVNLIP